MTTDDPDPKANPHGFAETSRDFLSSLDRFMDAMEHRDLDTLIAEAGGPASVAAIAVDLVGRFCHTGPLAVTGLLPSLNRWEPPTRMRTHEGCDISRSFAMRMFRVHRSSIRSRHTTSPVRTSRNWFPNLQASRGYTVHVTSRRTH